MPQTESTQATTGNQSAQTEQIPESLKLFHRILLFQRQRREEELSKKPNLTLSQIKKQFSRIVKSAPQHRPQQTFEIALVADPQKKKLVDDAIKGFMEKTNNPVLYDFLYRLSLNEGHKTLLASAFSNLSDDDARAVLNRMYSFWEASAARSSPIERDLFMNETLQRLSGHKLARPKILVHPDTDRTRPFGTYDYGYHYVNMYPLSHLDHYQQLFEVAYNRAMSQSGYSPTQRQLLNRMYSLIERGFQSTLLHELVHASFTPDNITFIEVIDGPEVKKAEEDFLRRTYGKSFKELVGKSAFVTVAPVRDFGSFKLYVVNKYDKVGLLDGTQFVFATEAFEHFAVATTNLYLKRDSKTLDNSEIAEKIMARIRTKVQDNMTRGGTLKDGFSLVEAIAVVGSAILDYYLNERKPVTTYSDFINALDVTIKPIEISPTYHAYISYTAFNKFIEGEVNKVKKRQRSPFLELMWQHFIGGFARNYTVPYRFKQHAKLVEKGIV